MSEFLKSVLLIHIASCFFMTGVIWLVQILLYPLFKLIGEKEFFTVHQFHMRKITWIVAPLMAIELFTACFLFYQIRSQVFLWNLLSVLVLWILTAFLNVPSHNQLSFKLDSSKNELILRNWPRTLIWTTRSLLLLILFLTVDR